MGFLSSYLERKNDTARAQQAAELEKIRAANETARLEKAYQLQQQQADIERVTQQKILQEAWERTVAQEHPEWTPQQVSQEAELRYARYIASSPDALTQTNLATSAIQQGKQKYETGAMPYRSPQGEFETKAATDEAINRGTNSMFNTAVTLGSFPFAGTLGRTGAQAGIAKAVEDTAKATAAAPYYQFTAPAEAGAKVAQSGAAATEANKNAQIAGAIDPGLAADAANAAAKAQKDILGGEAASGRLTSSLGGVSTKELPPLMLESLYRQGTPLGDRFTSALMQNMPQYNPSAANIPGSPNPSALTPRGTPLFNINDPRFKRQY